jgi:hypothetical protein
MRGLSERNRCFALPGTVGLNVDTALAYDSEYSLHWGQGKSMIKALPTTVRLANGTVINDIKWGLPETEDRKDVHR